MFIVVVIFIKVTQLTKAQVRELRELIQDLSFIAAHPLSVGITTTLVIILFTFKMRVSATLLGLFSVIFMFLYVKMDELMGELREAVSYIAAHPLLFGMLNIIKITVFFFHMGKWIIIMIINITVFIFHMSMWITVKMFQITVFIFHVCKRMFNFLAPLVSESMVIYKREDARSYGTLREVE